MSRPKPDLQTRKENILTCARELILRQGYEKTSFEDISIELGLSRPSIYTCFANKDQLFSAILTSETRCYLTNMEEAIRSNSDCDSIADMFRIVMSVISRSPLLLALLKRDRHVFGSFLLMHPQIFSGFDSTHMWSELLTKLRSENLIPSDINIAVFSKLMTSTAMGIMLDPTSQKSNTGQEISLEDILDTFSQLIDRALPRPLGGKSARTRELIIESVHQYSTQFQSLAPRSK